MGLVLGADDGIAVGDVEGDADRNIVGKVDPGLKVTKRLGGTDTDIEGFCDGFTSADGTKVGDLVGLEVGNTDGLRLGLIDGVLVGGWVGYKVGRLVGCPESFLVGCPDGWPIGHLVG